MAHGRAKVVVPVRPVERLTVLGEIARPRHSRQLVVAVHGLGEPGRSHKFRWQFLHDGELASMCVGPC